MEEYRCDLTLIFEVLHFAVEKLKMARDKYAV